MSAPIILVKYNPNWPDLFKKERETIMNQLKELAVQVEHIGSTAIPGLDAKPILDIMVGVQSLKNDGEKCIQLLEEIGYKYDPRKIEALPERISLDKVIDATQIFLYIVEINTDYWERHILFREYLKSHPNSAKKYNKLKKTLAKKYRNDRTAYTNGKSEFVKEIEGKAKKERTKYI